MKLSSFSLFALASVFAVSAVMADEAAAPKGTDLSVTLGGSLNRGNTETQDANAAIDVEGAFSDIGTYKAGAKANYAETKHDDSDDEKTVDNREVTGRLDFPVAGPLSTYIDASYLADDIADLDYRVLVGPGLSYNFVKTETAEFRIDLGISPMWEKIADESEYYTMLRTAEYGSYTLDSGAKIWESCEYLPALNNSDKYLINAEIGIESPLNDRLSLRLVAEDKYNSLPAEGNEKNDLRLTAAIRIKL